MKRKQKIFSWLEKHGATYKIMLILYKHDLMLLKSPLVDEYYFEAKKINILVNSYGGFLDSDYGVCDLVCKVMDQQFAGYYSKHYYSDVQLLKVQREIREVYKQLDTKIYERIFG
jgi:hypothetical protein